MKLDIILACVMDVACMSCNNIEKVPADSTEAPKIKLTHGE
jgi:hypothetical protein